jgi:mono/diheme cytochrome c family protein
MTGQLNRIGCWACSVLLGIGLGRSTLAWDKPPETPQFDAEAYLSLVKPVLEQRCYACHGALKQAGGLRLDTAELALLGGDSGPAVLPGDVDASLLLERIGSEDEHERMPPEGEPLHDEQIAMLAAWIRGGASAPPDEAPESDPSDHWAFRPPQRPSLPAVFDPSWGENPIDRFLAAAHHEHGLVPQPLADRWLWLRRVTLDLSGLPPSSSEQAAFLADATDQADQRVVDRLLASPRYGERWGRHWMDIWRYSDWWGLGDEVRSSQPHIWHWRDWIVESLNADVGYDQMLREMLAADELYPNDLQRLRGTGFLARQYFKFNRTTWLDGLVEHTGKAMLGLTFNCAKCHDHKYDPISQRDYYALRAIFEPYQLRTEAVAGQLDHRQGGIPRAFDCNLDAETFLHIRGDDRQPDESGAIAPGLPELLTAELPLVIEPVVLPLEAYRPGLRPFVRDELRRQAQQQLDEAEKLRHRASLTVAELPQTSAGGPLAETASGERRRVELEL